MWWIVGINGKFHAVHHHGPPPNVFSGPFASKAAALATLPGGPPTSNPNGPSPPSGGSHSPGPGPGSSRAFPAVSATALVGNFERYKGTPYITAGANPRLGWDCSGAINWNLGHDFNMRIPGQARPGFSGKTHGPVVVDYVSWNGATTVPDPQAGDLCIWPGIGNNGHIGMAISPTHMISALNHALGTAESPIHGSGPLGVSVMFRRITAVGGSAGGCLPGSALIIAFLRLAGHAI